MSLNDTPRGSRLHIGIFGKRNSGKSSLINALTGQDIALVSHQPGTTTDPVMKSMELHPIGPVVFIDTAGFDDEGELGKLRVNRTEDVIGKTDVAILVIDGKLLEDKQARRSLKALLAEEAEWAELLKDKQVPVILAINKWGEGLDDMEDPRETAASTAGPQEKDRSLQEGRISEKLEDEIRQILGEVSIVTVSAKTGMGLALLRDKIGQEVSEDLLRQKILEGMICPGGLAVLVMPQDIQAPKGRLILPQVQTLRELLDRRCTAVATTADGLEKTLSALNSAPDLIITDSQCFGMVAEKKPEESSLTSFSVLFAAYKGDIDVFVKGASVLDDLTENSRVLIAEACTHVPLTEDIGREKIPAMLRKRVGEKIQVVNVCGNDFPRQEELAEFDLIVHCGACMFNRKHVLSRISQAQQAGVPITNYGILLAKAAGILGKIKIPQGQVSR